MGNRICYSRHSGSNSTFYTSSYLENNLFYQIHYKIVVSPRKKVMRPQLITLLFFSTCGCFSMTSTAHGKNWNEPQNLSKVETENNLEADYDSSALVESRAEGISPGPYDHLILREKWKKRFGKCEKRNSYKRCKRCCKNKEKKCTKRNQRTNKPLKTGKPTDNCTAAAKICSENRCPPASRK